MSTTITDDGIADAEVESAETQAQIAWAQQIRRRVSDWRSGKATTRPIDEVLHEVDEMLR